MTAEQLHRIAHYLLIVDMYFSMEPCRKDQQREVEELRRAISEALKNDER